MTGAIASGARKTMKRAIERSGNVMIEVAIPCARWRRAVAKPAALARAAAVTALEQAGYPRGSRAPAELSLVLADDATVRTLNARWRGKDAPTNVLAFAIDEAGVVSAGALATPLLLGDVVLAFETVAAEARQQGKSLADHLRHLVVHGVLHLLGYDHIVPGEARRMEALEIRILARLGVADPYHLREAVDG